jgi:chromosome segregation ATPase
MNAHLRLLALIAKVKELQAALSHAGVVEAQLRREQAAAAADTAELRAALSAAEAKARGAEMAADATMSNLESTVGRMQVHRTVCLIPAPHIFHLRVQHYP